MGFQGEGEGNKQNEATKGKEEIKLPPPPGPEAGELWKVTQPPLKGPQESRALRGWGRVGPYPEGGENTQKIKGKKRRRRKKENKGNRAFCWQ